MSLYKKEEIVLNDRKEDEFEKLVAPQAAPWKLEIKPKNVVAMSYIHLAGLYGLYISRSSQWPTMMFMYIYFLYGCVSITAGAHRLWAHRSYKAKLPLQVILMLGFSSVMQVNLTWWVLNHRQHHQYSDTDGDPHNATRGIVYSHIGWLLVKRHPEAVKRRKLVKASDILNDPVLKFNKRYSVLLMFVMGVLVPFLIPVLCWGESFNLAWHLNLLRLAITYNVTWLVNSFAHFWGNKPYDKNLVAVQNTAVSFFSFGEGFHNYHHAFPWDYRVAELGNNWLNFTTWVIDQFALIGWAYDLKTVNQDIVNSRASRTGDGSNLWGMKLRPTHLFTVEES